LALIRERGAKPKVVEYLKTPPSSDEIRSLVQKMGVSVQHPILMQRLIVVTPLGVRVCRPAQTVLEILPAAHGVSR
jgi:arsenate reductase